MTDKIGTKAPLSPSNQEFGYLEYFLQLSLRSTTAKIQNANVINNPHLMTLFDRQCRDILTLNCWIDCQLLQGINTEEEVIKRGFQFGSGGIAGIKVSVGRLKLSEVLKDKSTTKKRLMFCKIGVGRAYVADSVTAETQDLPEGYDSFHLLDSSIRNQGSTAKSSVGHDEENSTVDSHSYFIKNAVQRAKCDNCEVETATLYCSADAANLCNKCDFKLHESKLATRHSRTPIGKGADIFGQCRHHPDKLIEFFCAQCHIPVCVYCKMVGNHANGDAAKHQLVSVSEAYHTVLEEADTLDPVLQQRRNDISNQIAAIRSRGKAVEKQHLELQGFIDSIHKRLSFELNDLIAEKMNVLLGDEIELKRQMGEIDSLDDFLKYQKTGDATHFLFSWARHQLLRSDLHDFKFFRDEIDVHLDLKIQGSLAIVQDNVVNGSPTRRSASPTRKVKNAEYSESNQNDESGHKNYATAPSEHFDAQESALPSHFQNPPQTYRHNGGVPSNSYAAVNNKQNGPVYPKRLVQEQQRKIQRRTSDFFAETLGAFDQFSLSHDYEEMNGRILPRNA